MNGQGFESLGTEVVYEGAIFTVQRARFRHDDGGEVVREKVHHDGAAGILAYDHDYLYLVRQPREAIERSDVLEIPAGRLDVENEPAQQTARRELAEEVGLAADTWSHATTFYSSAGFTDEEVHLFLATDLREVERPQVDEEERIELVRWPLGELDAAIDATVDAKTLIALLWLRRARSEGAPA